MRQANVTLVVALEVIEQIGGVSAILVTPFLRQRIPLPPVESEHAMENPPSFQRFGDVRVAHKIYRPCFVLASG
jgi:hypothetical protein